MGSHADKSIFSNSALRYSSPLFTAYMGQASMPYLVSVCRPQYQVCSPLEMPTDLSGTDLQASKKDLAQEYQTTCAQSNITTWLKNISGQLVCKTSMTKVLKKPTNQEDQWRK